MTTSIPGKGKINAKRYVETLLPRLIEEYRSLLSSGFIFQQDGAPAHMAQLAQDWIATNYSEFIGKDESPRRTSEKLCLNTTRYSIPSQRTLMD